MPDILIDPEFAALIPPLSAEELAGLEASIKREGCRDALIGWRQIQTKRCGVCSDTWSDSDPTDLCHCEVCDHHYPKSSGECGNCHKSFRGHQPDVLPIDAPPLLMDGHNRKAICEKLRIEYDVKLIPLFDRAAAKEWIIRNQFARRNLTTFARSELALKLEPLIAAKAKAAMLAGTSAEGGGGRGKKNPVQISAQGTEDRKTREQVAKAAGVSHETIRAAKYVQERADEQTKAKLRTDPNVKLHRVVKDLREKEQRGKRQVERKAAAKDIPADERIIIGDFREHAERIPDGSVSLIFTDPPYDRKASKMLPDLAAFAAAKLADGGSLLCYVGQTQLPAALDAFREHLRYWWMVACVHSGGNTVMREYGINCGWKAVLWFVKGTRDDNSIMVSDVMSGGREKDQHEWQQAESEAAYWIEKLCPKDGVVCDPFLGGGTTAAAAKKLNRKWIGFEIDPATAKIASERVQ